MPRASASEIDGQTEIYNFVQEHHTNLELHGVYKLKLLSNQFRMSELKK